MLLSVWEQLIFLPRSPSSALYPFVGEGSPTKIDYRKNGHPYSNLSTGGPSCNDARKTNNSA